MRVSSFVVLTSVVLACALPARGQTFNQVQGGGGFGGQTGGFGGQTGGFGGQSGGQSGGFGGQSGGQGGGGSGMFGNRNLGGSITPGNRSFGGGGNGGNANIGGQVQGNERFLRNNRRPGQFVGSDSNDVASFIGGIGGNSQRLGGQQFGILGGNQQRQQDRQNQNQNQNEQQNGKNKIKIRPRLKADFPVVSRGGSQLSAALQRRLNRSTWIQALSPLEVEIEGQTAILRGEVATDHDRALAEQVALLEAGISEVQNELTLPEPAVKEPAVNDSSTDAPTELQAP